MTTFTILSGKALKGAIANYGKTAATFAERTHQLAYSALLHVENHHDAVYCNAIYTATPKNYRGAVVAWMKAFGKVSFDSAKSEFTYSKGRKSDLPAALAVSPADYSKAKSAKPGTAGKSLLDKLESQMEAVLDSDDASDQDRDVAAAVNRVLATFRKNMPKVEAAPKASNVVPLQPEGEAVKQAAPKASKPKVAKSDKPAKVPAPKAATQDGDDRMMTAKEAAAEARARMAETSSDAA